MLAYLGAVYYLFPSRRIKIIGITGTKGKSSTTELINAILEEAGYRTALSNTIRFKIGDREENNLYKMSMPGRFAIQRWLRQAVRAKCDYAILEMTSQGFLQYRHKHIALNAFIFTNISPEHLDAHGSFENYLFAKVSLARELSYSHKKSRILIVNGDDKEAPQFMSIPLTRKGDIKKTFSIQDAGAYKIADASTTQNTNSTHATHSTKTPVGITFVYKGEEIHSPLQGVFNLYNILAAATLATELGISTETIKNALEKFNGIRGRVEHVQAVAHQPFECIVDYAHTPDSLEKLYQVFEKKSDEKNDEKSSGVAAEKKGKNICVLGGTGGGRDKWKRKRMGEIADTYCDDIILTNEDPYDEDPRAIVDDVASGISTKKPTILMDRRIAIREAVTRAKKYKNATVLITGKGTDPYIMGPRGSKTPWNDAQIAREEILKLYRK